MDIAALHAMAARWGRSAGELTRTGTPADFAAPSQPSAAAVQAAHADVAAFTAAMANQVDARAQHVTDASTRFTAHDAHAVSEIAALNKSPTIV